jgi:perosamine synthetase
MSVNSFIPQMEPWFGVEEKEEINKYLDEGGWMTEFKRTAQFEKQIADYCGAKHCIIVNNGTISLTLAAIACGIGIGDEVIVPNYTMIATPNSIKMIGATPVFVDVEPDTLCIDIEGVKKAITPRTKAIIFVSANGRYPKYGIAELEHLAKVKGIALIEDAAQSLGSFYPDGRHIGLAGDVGSFSFSAPKVISTGQGGALITNNDEIAFKLKRLKDFGRSGGGNDVHDVIGYNFKFTELQACLGVVQMKKLAWRVERKKEIYKQYRMQLSRCEKVTFFEQDLVNTTPWFIDVKVENRENLINHLKENGIGSRTMYPPINKQKAYELEGDYPVSNEIGHKGLWLPSAAQLTDEQIAHITSAVIEFY